jgi:3-oxoacyl-[acyl-carrier-protein] synthase-3
MYKNILLVAAETHSYGLDFSTRGRNVSVIFGDGAGAVVLQPVDESANVSEQRGILSTHLHSDGNAAEILSMINPGFHAGKFVAEKKPKQPDQPYGGMFITKELIEKDDIYPNMDGPAVFKIAVIKFPEVILEALDKNNLKPADLKLLIPHQANLRISQFVQHKLKLRDDQVFNNIQKYGNTTAASIPIALCEAWEQGKINDGDLVCLAAFGSGFTWGSALIRW